MAPEMSRVGFLERRVFVVSGQRFRDLERRHTRGQSSPLVLCQQRADRADWYVFCKQLLRDLDSSESDVPLSDPPAISLS
ncbi:hypothetical protein F2P81_009263 [Scophthalmus maximus]|uniref:Uncharacterized protein n=1 Tax=Scophthalmus maximus TaxID=52904 RepID=A0A6A4T1A6_SCOMX|nr:hypothetical protein F2P81_009263 [Scophthalmus maximus]